MCNAPALSGSELHHDRFTFVSSDAGNSSISTIRSHAMLAVRRNQRQDRIDALKKRKLPARVSHSIFCKCASPIIEELHSSWEPDQDTNKSQGSQKQLVVTPSWICSKCGNVQPFELSKTGQIRARKENIPIVIPFLEHLSDPFHSFPSPFKMNPEELHDLEEVKRHLFTFYAPGRVRSVAIPLARDDLCLLVSMLFAGISNVAAKHNRDLSPLALRFKGEAIRLINQKMENQELAAHPVNICSIMHVASGVRTFRGATDVHREVAMHESGLTALVRSRSDSLNTITSNPAGATLAPALSIHHNCIAAINGQLPDNACDITEQDVPEFTNGLINESPLYRITASFDTISTSKCSSARLLHVLNATYDLVDLVIQYSDGDPNLDPYSSSFSKIQRQITGFSSINKQDRPTKGDHIYESSRLASVVMLYCVEKSLPFSKTPQSLVDMLVSAVKKTNVGDNWDDFSGVMYWVILVGAAVTQGRSGPGYMDSLLTQLMLHMCFSGYSLDSGLEPPRKFGRFHHIIKTRWGGADVI